jgi:bacteriocin-like protein
MLKKTLHFSSVKLLTNKELKNIKGGLACGPNGQCPAGTHCVTSGTFEGLCRRN